MAQQLRLLCKGVNYAPYIAIETVKANNNINPRQDEMEFSLYLNKELPRPRAGQEVIWGRFDSTTGAEIPNGREFAGVITEVREVATGGGLLYSVRVDTYQRWFDRRLVTGLFQSQSAGDFVKAIVGQYCSGFSTANVVAPISIPAKYLRYQRPSKAIEMALDQIGYGFYLDPYKGVHVYRAEDFASPLPGGLLDVDNDLTNYGDLELTEDTSNVWNRFTLLGYKQRSNTPYTLRLKGDGTSTQFQLGYKPSSAKGDVSVSVNNVPYPVKPDLISGSPAQGSTSGIAYVHYTQALLRFASPPAPGAEIAVTMYFLTERTRMDQDDASIEYMKTLESANDGVFEYVEKDTALTGSTADAASAKLQLMALKYGFPTLSGSFTSFTQGWRAGMTFRMSSKERMDGLSPDNRWYVYSVEKSWIHPQHGNGKPIQYKVTFLNRPKL